MVRQMLGLAAFATIAIILMQISSSTACMCMPKHSQSSYCDSDYGKCDGNYCIHHNVIIIYIRCKHEYFMYASTLNEHKIKKYRELCALHDQNLKPYRNNEKNRTKGKLNTHWSCSDNNRFTL